MSLFCALVGLSFFLFDGCVGRVWYDDDGNAVSGLQIVCTETQVCMTHFSKMVYASSRPVLDHDWTPKLFPHMYDQFDSQLTCGLGSKFIAMDTCGQIHSPMTPSHAEGDITVQYVEEQYSVKWENIRNNQKKGIYKYDAFLDNTVGYWVDDLGYYYQLWKELDADIVYLKWNIKDDEDKVFYSLITHNGDEAQGSTLTQYEVISDTFSTLEKQPSLANKMILTEQRMFYDDNTDYRSLTSGCQTYPIGPRRAVTSVDDNINWYKKIFGASIIDPDTQIIVDTYNNVKYGHIKLHQAEESVIISFFERESDSTYGDFSVLDFENTMTNTHSENMLTPFCGLDRWFDMHYALDFHESLTSEKVLETLMFSGERYTLYNQRSETADTANSDDVTSADTSDSDDDVVSDGYPTFIYITEPNGQSVQLVFEGDSNMVLETMPAIWDSQWCPIECTDDMLNYNYGDRIATFSFENDDDNDADNDNAEMYNVNNINNKHGNNNMLNYVYGAIVAIVFAAALLLLVIGYNNNDLYYHTYQKLGTLDK